MNFSSSSSKLPIKIPLRSWDIWETLLLCLLIFGTFGNLLTIFVMRSKRMRKTNESLFMTSISIADISLLFIKFFVNMQKMYRIPIYNACIFIHYAIPQTIAWFIYWMIVVITIERSLAVYKPFQVNTILSKERCRCIIFTILTIFALLSSTQIPCLEYYKKWPHFCNIKRYSSSNDTITDDFCYIYMNRVFPWIKSSLMSFLPWSLAVVFNLVIIVSLFKATQLRKRISSEMIDYRRENSSNKESHQLLHQHEHQQQHPQSLPNTPTTQNCNIEEIIKASCYSCHSLPTKPTDQSKPDIVKMDKNQSKRVHYNRRNSSQMNHFKLKQREYKEKQITITLCTISISFILFTAPFAIYELLRRLNSENKNFFYIFHNRNLHRLVHFLVDCLHATNFILYCLVGQRFRKELKRLICQQFYSIFDKLNFIKLKNIVARSASDHHIYVHVDYTNKRASNEKIVFY